MEKIKKISLVITILILLGCVFVNRSYAEIRCNVNLNTASTEVTKGSEFSVYVRISNLNSTKGIIAMGTALDYDKNALTLVSVKGENGWSNPFYNESNGKMTSVKNDYATTDENVIKIDFKVNENAGSTASIEINNFQISDGNEETNIGGALMTISIKDKNTEVPTQPENPTTPTDPGNNSGNNSGSSSSNNNKPSGNRKPSTNNNAGNNVVGNEILDNEIQDNETNENNEINENVSNQNKIDFEINENFNYKTEENTSKKSGNTKTITYAICIGGVIISTAIMILIIKSSKEKEEN